MVNKAIFSTVNQMSYGEQTGKQGSAGGLVSWKAQVLAPFLVASGLKDKPVLHSSVSAVHHVDSTNMPL